MIYKNQKVLYLCNTGSESLGAHLKDGYQMIAMNNHMAVIGKPVEIKEEPTATTNNATGMIKRGSTSKGTAGDHIDFEKLFQYISERLDADPDVKAADIMKSLYGCDPGGYYYKEDGTNRFNGDGTKIPDDSEVD